MDERDSLFDAHAMVTDWSGAGLDFGLGLEKPVLFIDVPPKTRNDSWQELGIEPFERSVRDRIGAILRPDRLTEAPDLIRRLVRDLFRFRCEIGPLRDECVFNLGHSAAAGSAAITRVARAVTAGGGDRSGRR
jgi:YidC/Oxa1 family membrane protein insertase